MPQFDPTYFASQIFWLAIVFATLYWFMRKHAIPKVEATLTARAERIQGDLDRAAKLQQQAAELAEQHAETLAKSRDEARKILSAAQAETQADLDKRQALLADDIAKRTADAESRINAAREDAMKGVREIAVDAAGAVAARLLGAEPSAEKAASAVDAAMERRAH